VVDMSRAAVTSRLREMARLSHERGIVAKGVDMSPAAVTARLKMLSALSDMCLRLAAAGKELRNGRPPSR
jgi:hypothetical protein